MTHRLTITRTYADGDTQQTVMAQGGTAADAHANRVRRLRDIDTPHEAGPGWVEFTDRWSGGYVGATWEPGGEYRVRLEYTDAPAGRDGGSR